jgi:hypothetical protein
MVHTCHFLAKIKFTLEMDSVNNGTMPQHLVRRTLKVCAEFYSYPLH